MDIYNLLADGLLEIESKNQDYFIWLNDSETNLSFGFQHKKNYSGLMTKISPKYIEKAKDKQGYFDILGITGIHRKIKHETLFKELLLYTTLEECKAVWRGIMPSINQFDKKHSSLATLAILMFEQEVNFGNEIWQRNTRFAPDISNPKFKRPRDLLMGYINVAFIEGLNRLDDFKNKKGQLMPTNDTEVLKKYFYPLRNDEHAAALMTGTTLEKFNMAIFDKGLNPYKFKHYNKK